MRDLERLEYLEVGTSDSSDNPMVALDLLARARKYTSSSGAVATEGGGLAVVIYMNPTEWGALKARITSHGSVLASHMRATDIDDILARAVKKRN